MRGQGAVAALAVVAASAGCGTTQAVRPIGQGGLRAELSLGGPLFGDLGVPIPMPIALVGARYGVIDRLDVHARWNVLLAAFGAFGMDAGASGLILQQHGFFPALAGGVLATLVTDGQDTNVFPELTLSLSWDVHRGSLVYLGLTNFYELAPQFRYHPAIFVGGRWQATRRFGATVELKWISPHEDSTFGPVGYVSPGGLGAFSVLLGFDFDILEARR
jgi:hypothetical protein